jgi:uncharacterized membrane protein (DUF4010 family)
MPVFPEMIDCVGRLFMNLSDLFARFAVALGIGLLIGLERGWRSRGEEPGQRTAGIRTFGLTGLLGAAVGALTGFLSGPASPGGGILLGLSFAVYSAVLAWFCREENRADGRFSVTTTVAGMVVFALAAYAVLGDLHIAAAAAVAAAALLAMREGLHGWLQRLTWDELRAALILLTMTFIALPLLPNQSVGPYGGINPREVWLIAIVLAAVSFLGYVVVKGFGPSHGVLLASVAGGLVSSTAVTVANARHAFANANAARLLAGGVAAATTVCFLRVVAIVAVLKSSLIVLLAPALVAAAATAATCALILVYGGRANDGKQQAFEIRNPFSFWPVVWFALLLSTIIMLTRAAAEVFGASGAVVSAILVGLADVDSVTISIVKLAPQPLSEAETAVAILAAVASNTVSKIAVGAAIARGKFAFTIALVAASCIAAGVAVFALGLRFASGA